MPYTLQLGAKAPNFTLPATDDKNYSLNNFNEAKALVIFFTCNHCPYVTGSDENTRLIAEKFKKQGILFVAINSNSEETYKEDSFQHMKERMTLHKFPWVYLHDESQKIAQAYGALCTPHFYLFNQNRELIYCGRAVDHPRDQSKITTHDLENSIEEHLNNKPISAPLTNPIGCNIKWKGKAAKWMPDDACNLI